MTLKFIVISNQPLIVALLVLIVGSCHQTAGRSVVSKSSCPLLGNEVLVEGCPFENYHGIKSITHGVDSQNAYASIGQKREFECDSENSTFKLKQLKFPNEYFVYPMPNRTCQPNGTWSSVPPACLWHRFEMGERNYTPTRMDFCSDADCPEARQNWQSIGQIHPSCSKNKRTLLSEPEQFQVYFEFARHVHLSYMTFILADDRGIITRPFDVEVWVHPEDVIHELSPQSSKFLRDHYDFYAGQKAPNECAIIEIAAYTKSLLVRFSVEKPAKSLDDEIDLNTPIHARWRPRPLFYPISELNSESERKLAWYGTECPKAPEIPKGFVKGETDANGNKVLFYSCQEGYTMIDPATNKTSNGKITCINRFEWAPYPFPICLPNIKEYANHQRVNPHAKADEKMMMDAAAEEFAGDTMNQNIIPSTPIVTSASEQDATEYEDDFASINSGSKNDSSVLLYIVIAGVLFVLLLVFVSIIVFVCVKGKGLLPKAAENDQREPPNTSVHGRSGPFVLKPWGSKYQDNRYTIISQTYSLNSTRSEHVYEEIK